MQKNKGAVEKALLILNKEGQGCTAEEMLALSKELKKEQAFGYARRILALARKDHALEQKFALKLDQQCALCTYKDQDLPVAGRLEDALQILREGRPDLNNTADQETLGLAGAVFKRKWEVDGQRKNLESSFYYYKKGFDQGALADGGYTGINAAFVLDLLAQLGSKDQAQHSLEAEQTAHYKAEAENIRRALIDALTGPMDEGKRKKLENDWWYCVTVAEAYFGLGEYEAARPWLKKAVALDGVEEWQRESTTRQLAQLALLHDDSQAAGIENSLAWEVLKELVAENEDEVAALQTAFTGKVGLALSGGGFRASLYHIGVLARLAELDVLRRVEVLSCVSGGSIIGAHYYLEVRNLLQTKTDKAITPEDYITIVKKINRDFLAGVQRNIRTRVVANWWDNFKMLWSKEYTRTNKLGALYEQELYTKVKDGEEGQERWLNHLYIHPLQKSGRQDTGFNPKYDNWLRRAKVPILILNATSLNTGHNWQFTASWMGETPASIQKIDGNYRLRRMYYKDDGDKEFRRTIRLGHAVAASSCVPGMFEPLALSNLYEGKVVRLVDGGVHDNQGICGLLEQDCTVMLVSDASGQMGSEDNPTASILGVPLRANDILMERVRNAQYQDMASRATAGLLKGFLFIHLKMGLDVQTVDWINCEDPSEDSGLYRPSARITAYNIRKDMQQHLASIRTDLDSFNDTEAHALMASGYLMTAFEFDRCIKNFPAPVVQEQPEWDFLNIEDELRDPAATQDLIRLLRVAKERMFKVWKLSNVLQGTAIALGVLLVAGLVWSIYHWYELPLVTVGKVGWMLFFLVLGFFVSKTVIRVIRYRDTLVRFAVGLGLITFAWLAANLHLLVFDKLYLKKGKRRSSANTDFFSEGRPQIKSGVIKVSTPEETQASGVNDR